MQLVETKEQIEAWLALIGWKREDLATELGVSKGTVDNWFSKGFPVWAKKAMDRLANPQGDDSAGLEVSFTHKEWQEIERAMRIGGYTLHRDFYHDTILEGAREIIEKEQALFVGEKVIHAQEQLMAAEQPAKYKTGTDSKRTT